VNPDHREHLTGLASLKGADSMDAVLSCTGHKQEERQTKVVVVGVEK